MYHWFSQEHAPESYKNILKVFMDQVSIKLTLLFHQYHCWQWSDQRSVHKLVWDNHSLSQVVPVTRHNPAILEDVRRCIYLEKMNVIGIPILFPMSKQAHTKWGKNLFYLPSFSIDSMKTWPVYWCRNTILRDLKDSWCFLKYHLNKVL